MNKFYNLTKKFFTGAFLLVLLFLSCITAGCTKKDDTSPFSYQGNNEKLSYESSSVWSSWTAVPITPSVKTEVQTRETIIGYNMVHYGTQQNEYPHYRMFRGYSIIHNLADYGARESYGEKHFTRIATPDQLSSAKVYSQGVFITGEYPGYQMDDRPAYSFGDDKYVWYIESTDKITEYRSRETDLFVPTPVPSQTAFYPVSSGIFLDGPSVSDFDSVYSDGITYPLYTSYLNSYESQYVRAPGAVSVSTYYTPAEDSNCKRDDLLYEGMEVIVLARENGMSCIIYRNGDRLFAAWMNSSYLVY